jgi:hypothetical protein
MRNEEVINRMEGIKRENLAEKGDKDSEMASEVKSCVIVGSGNEVKSLG